MKKVMIRRQLDKPDQKQPGDSPERKRQDPYDSEHVLEEAAMEVAADAENPYPAPHFPPFSRFSPSIPSAHLT